MNRPTTTKAGRHALTALLLPLTALLLAGCWIGPGSDGSSGVVIDRDRWNSRGWGYRHSITIRQDDGKTDKGMVTRKTYEACQVGDRWPDCKNN